MGDFGIYLRNFRESCRDPIFRARKLSQVRFGELVGKELGAHEYSGAAVSDWERGKSKLHVDDRRVLLAIVKVLHECGGIKSESSANQLLEAGDYRTLNSDEKRNIFQDIPNGTQVEPIVPGRLSWLADMFSISQDELDQMLDRTSEGPAPSWPRMLAALIRKTTDRFSISRTMIVWIWIWLLAWGMIRPSLQLPFPNRDTAFLNLSMYASCTLIVPLLIGLLVNTKDSEYWKTQADVSPLWLRLYTYQGAGVGFNVGYFLVFPLSLARHYLGFGSTIWIGILAATVSVVLGNMGAHVVPHNLWRAYERLTFKDGGLFFVVALMGPLWAFFFLEYYTILLRPTYGVIIILLALTGVVILSAQISKTETNKK